MIITQNAPAVLMIRPVRFGFNQQTAATNTFQQQKALDSPEIIQQKALQEFNDLVYKLNNKGVETIVFDDTPEPHTPDSIFPNNWFSTHANGQLLIYPMSTPNRRAERRGEFIVSLLRDHHFDIKNIIDISITEQEGIFLEGTGSMVIDHPNKIIYANLSPRTQMVPLLEAAKILKLELVTFRAIDPSGIDIYHTNVLMNIGENLAIVCLDSLPDLSERKMVESKLVSSGKKVVNISYAQMNAFAGNMLHLKNQKGERLVFMSQSAWNSLESEQKLVIENDSEVVTADISTIEHYGGGSVRCMMGDIHLPKF